MSRSKKPKAGKAGRSTTGHGTPHGAPHARTRPKFVSLEEIDSHMLLDNQQKKFCRIMRNEFRQRGGESFTMLDFAKRALRDDGSLRAEALQYDDILAADESLQRSALLYAHELILDQVTGMPPVALREAALLATSILKVLAMRMGR